MFEQGKPKVDNRYHHGAPPNDKNYYPAHHLWERKDGTIRTDLPLSPDGRGEQLLLDEESAFGRSGERDLFSDLLWDR
jgi:hypothetical protein